MILNIFDFDGTVVDSSDALFKAYQYAFKTIDKDLQKNTWNNFFGKHFSELIRDMNVNERDAEIVHQIKYDIYPSFMNNIICCSATNNIFRNDNNINIIATHTKEHAVRELMSKLDIEKYFDSIVDIDSVGQIYKPSPMIFIEAIRRAFKQYHTNGINEINIYEDSDCGIFAAIDAAYFVYRYIDMNIKCSVFRVVDTTKIEWVNE